MPPQTLSAMPTIKEALRAEAPRPSGPTSRSRLDRTGGFLLGPLAVVICALFVGACGGTESVTAKAQANDLSISQSPPDGLLANGDGTSYTAPAGLGDDLALVRQEYVATGARASTQAAFRTPSGEWGQLPVPQTHGDFDLASAGNTVVFGGLECLNDDCTQYQPRFLILNSDRSGWEELDSGVGPIEAVPETAAVGVNGSDLAMDHAVFKLGLTDYSVSAEGVVEVLTYPDVPDPERSSGFYCLTDDSEIVLTGDTSGDDGPVKLTGDVNVRRLDAIGEGFQPVASALDVEVDRFSAICGYRELTLQSGATSYTFDLDENMWSTSESNYMEVNGGITVAEGPGGQIALPDGTVYESNRTRAPNGEWSLIPNGLILIPTTSGIVYALSVDGVSTFKGI